MVKYAPKCQAIPEDFARNFKKKLATETVALKGPSGDTWSVGITEKDGNLFFSNGWPEFVENHSLKENGILFFKYKRDLCFEVLVLDKKSQCENPDSYFVRKHVPEDHTPTQCQTKRKTTEASVEGRFTASHSHGSDEHSPSLLREPVTATSRRRTERGGSRLRKEAKTSPGTYVCYLSYSASN